MLKHKDLLIPNITPSLKSIKLRFEMNLFDVFDYFTFQDCKIENFTKSFH